MEKTEAIDPAEDVWWFDDYPSDHDRDWLHTNGREDRLIVISVDHNSDVLLEARSLPLRSAA